jgi:glycosyltransferase involved in cell wall biosynthesis
MKIDYYTLGDPTDPAAWSGTYLELTTALENLGILQGAYNIRPPWLTSIKPGDKLIEKIVFILKNLKYFKYYERKIYLASEYYPDIVDATNYIAFKIYNSHPNPNAIIIHGDFAVFENTPFFIFHDLDMKTLLDWRQRGERTYMCDPMPIPILKKRMDQQQDVYAKASGLLIASDWIAKSIRSYIEEPEKVYTVGMGHRYEPIELKESLQQERFENPQLLFIGKNGVGKGIDIVLSAFEILREEMPQAKLKIITDIRGLPRTIKRELGKTDQGIDAYATGIPWEMLREFYLKSSIFVMPSRFDAWGKVFFEAMAFGMPVIGARNCAMPEFIKDGYNGYTTNYDPGEVADRILSIFGSFGKYKNMSENAMLVSKRYTWDKIAKNMIDIISKNIL